MQRQGSRINSRNGTRCGSGGGKRGDRFSGVYACDSAQSDGRGETKRDAAHSEKLSTKV
ncbi:MAG: hypothetical protein H0T51_20970 [Pirellulales bacterium]|nr:hypothetical protein [Pirellulales bacterium]